jgi:hypothetical protein
MEITAATRWFSLPKQAYAMFKIVFDKQFLLDGPQGLKPKPLCFLRGPTKVVP